MQLSHLLMRLVAQCKRRRKTRYLVTVSLAVYICAMASGIFPAVSADRNPENIQQTPEVLPAVQTNDFISLTSQIIAVAQKFTSTSEEPEAASGDKDEPVQETPEEPPEPFDPQPAYINSSSVRLRSQNNTDSDILMTMRRYTEVTVTGSKDDWFLVETGEKTGYVLGSYVTFGEVPEPEVEMLDWWDGGKSLMKIGTKGTLTDVATGITIDIRVMSSGNHADVEPLTKEDTAKLKKARGGKFSWTPRAALLTVGDRVIAVSYNGMPHSSSTIKNNDFAGHFCVHFLNSRNHYNNKLDPDHQKQVKIAAGL